MKRVKVCHLSSVHFALDTRIFYRFCLSLSEYYHVTLIAVHHKKETRNGINIVPFRRFKNKLLRVCFTWAIMFFKAVKQNARIYQIHDPELIPCGLLLAMIGKKVIYDVHENVAEDIFDKPWIRHKKILYSLYSFFELKAIRNFAIFLAELSYEQRFKDRKARYEIVLNYYNPDFFKPYVLVPRRRTFRIFYIGILLRTRGILEIIKAIHILKLRGMEVHFDVVGELYTGLDYEIDSLEFIQDIKPQLHFYGRLALEEGYEISKKAGLGMCIIHPMKNSIGSYPTKMFEYMAIGLPQVISNFELYKSVVETYECGICVNPLDPEQIADAIETALSNEENYSKMAENAVKYAPRYQWNSEFDKVLKTYQSLE